MLRFGLIYCFALRIESSVELKMRGRTLDMNLV